MPGRAAAVQPMEREARYAGLMAHASGQGNDDALARMHASLGVGEGTLPQTLGLSRAVYADLMAFHFPGFVRVDGPGAVASRDSVRRDEVAELESLLRCHRAGLSPSELWMASIVAGACLGSDHLWQDLGLWSRADLSALMQRNFPLLADKNVHNMKWKKFLYKQLCAAEGIYVCRAPSCEVCTDYHNCFGSEE